MNGMQLRIDLLIADGPLAGTVMVDSMIFREMINAMNTMQLIHPNLPSRTTPFNMPLAYEGSLVTCPHFACQKEHKLRSFAFVVL